MPKSSLQQLAAKFKHTGLASILVKGQNFFYKQEDEKTHFISAVHLLKEDQCRMLTRMGRDKITAIMVHEIISKEEAKNILKVNEDLLESFVRKTENQKLCFVRCDVERREINRGKLPR